MNNAELIDALRYCAEHEGCDYYIAKDCPRGSTWMCGADCEQILMLDAADALEAADKRIDGLQKLVDINTERCEALRKQLRESHENYEKHLNELEAKIPKEGEWLRTDAFPHRVYCSCCYKTYVPNENWQIWQDDADNFGLPRNYCPNCGARMRKREREETKCKE